MFTFGWGLLLWVPAGLLFGFGSAIGTKVAGRLLG